MTSLEAGEIRRGDLADQPPVQLMRPLSAASLLKRLVLFCAGIRVGLETIGLVSLAFHDPRPADLDQRPGSVEPVGRAASAPAC